MRSRSFSALGLARLHSLNSHARIRAVQDRARGGGPSPYRHALKALRRYVYESETRADIIEELSLLGGDDLADMSTDLFLRLTHRLAIEAGRFVDPATRTVSSPNDVFGITAKPHVSIEEAHQVTHHVFWNNKTTVLGVGSAAVAADLFMRCSEASLFRAPRFILHDLRSGKDYSHSEVIPEVRTYTDEFLVEVERLLKAATVRKLLTETMSELPEAPDSRRITTLR
jgi:hypothetical protein